MRLLHATHDKMEEVLADENAEKYVTLSHTWGKEEVTFQHWEQLLASSRPQIEAMAGYQKIDLCRQQARSDGYDWVWIDTCCIDKKSSSELTEAINSMYRWYANSDICYVYLEHVPDGDICASADSAFRRSPWFKRGWTLQELLAPREVVFYSRGWERLGTKRELCDIVASITGIHRRYLLGESHLDTASIARRMSWASERQTSRPEDMAYCLFGLFDINMPLIYGEGARKAFQRVQEAIMQAYPHDHTLFAWGEIDGLPSLVLMDSDQGWANHLPWKDGENRPRLAGMFAASPRDFAKSGHLVPSYFAATYYRYLDSSLPTPAGRDFVRLELPCQDVPILWSVYYWEEPRVTSLRRCLIARLLCRSEDEYFNSWSTIAIRLQYSQNGGFTRIGNPVNVADVWGERDLRNTRGSITVGPDPQKNRSLQSGDILFRRMIFSGRQKVTSVGSIGDFVYDENEGLARGPGTRLGGIIYYSESDTDESEDKGVAIVYHQAFPHDSREFSLTVSVFLTTRRRRPIRLNGSVWHPESQIPNVETPYSRVFPHPSKEWLVDIESSPHARIHISVERILLGDGRGSVFIVDQLVQDKTID